MKHSRTRKRFNQPVFVNRGSSILSDQSGDSRNSLPSLVTLDSDAEIQELYDDLSQQQQSYSDCDDNIGLQPPTLEAIQQLLSQLPKTNLTKQAWQALLDKNKHPHGYSTEYFPFWNELCCFLFLGRYDDKLGITRNILDFFIVILKTLQTSGIVSQDYYIPASGAVIEEYWQNLPQVPVCMYIIVILYTNKKWFEACCFFLSLH